MMKFISFLSLILWTLLSCPPAQAQNVPASNSLDWQRIELEEVISNEVRKNLSGILKPDEYVIVTSIKLKKEAISTTPSASSAANSDMPSKLGLDNDIAKMIASGQMTQNSDVFGMIQSVKVSIILEKTVTDEALKKVENIITTTVQPKTGKKPSLAVDRLELKAPTVVVKKTPQDWLLDLKDALGFVSGSFLLTLGLLLVAVMALGQFKKFEAKRIATFEAFIETQKVKNEDGNKGAEAAAEATATPEATPEANAVPDSELDTSGITRFQLLVEQNAARAALSLKTWLRMGTPASKAAVSLLTGAIAADALKNLVSHFSKIDKKLWQQAANFTVTPILKKQGLDFINQQMLNFYLAPPPAIEQDKLEKLLSLSEAQVLTLFQKDPQSSCVLMNILATDMITKVLEKLSDEEVQNLYTQASQLEESQIDARCESLAQNLDQYLATEAKPLSPFIEKSFEMIHQLSPSKEKFLFLSVAQSKNYSALEDLAKHCFPSECFVKLPPEVIRTPMMTLSNNARAELIAVQSNPELKTLLTSCIGEPGKKIRDMLDLELGEIEKNPQRLQLLQTKSSTIWASFAQKLRRSLQQADQHKGAIHSILQAWFAEITNGEFKGSSATTESTGDSTDAPKAA